MIFQCAIYFNDYKIDIDCVTCTLKSRCVDVFEHCVKLKTVSFMYKDFCLKRTSNIR